MKEVGGFLMLLGVGLAGYAMLGFDPTVGDTSFDRTVNLQLLAQQMLMVLAGGFGFVGGAVFFAFGEFFERYPRRKASEGTDPADVGSLDLG